MAAALEMSEGALKVAVHRLRQRYSELVRAEIAQTVANSKEADEELRYLCAVLRDCLARSKAAGRLLPQRIRRWNTLFHS